MGERRTDTQERRIYYKETKLGDRKQYFSRESEEFVWKGGERVSCDGFSLLVSQSLTLWRFIKGRKK